MNKDVLYVKSDDDIKKVAVKLRSSAKKIVAIVPPAEAPELFYSSANLRGLGKIASEAGKFMVVISKDPAVLRAAVSTHTTISSSLHSKPYIPTLDDAERAEVEEEEPSKSEAGDSAADMFTAAPTAAGQIIGEEKIVDNTKEESEPEEEDAEETEEESDEEDEVEKETTHIPVEDGEPSEEEMEDNLDAADKKVNSAEKKLKKADIDDNKKRRKKIIIIVCVVLALVLALTGILVWALTIAPAADIKVSIKTTSANFAENVTFVREESLADPESGIFYIEPLTYSETKEASFDATGKKTIGDKAKGTLTLSYVFNLCPATTSDGHCRGFETGTQVSIGAGTVFTQNGRNYYLDDGATITHNTTDCPITDNAKECTISVNATITAADVGDDYNVAANATWTNNSNSKITAKNPSEIKGGFSKEITVFSQSDMDSALNSSELAASQKSQMLKQLENSMETEYILIEDSYVYEETEKKFSVDVDAEVAEDSQVTGKRTFTYTVYTLDSSELEAYIKSAVTGLGEDQKIYAVSSPFIERYQSSDSSISGKLKATYKYGPEVTYDELLEMAKGQKIGDLRSRLKSVNGINNVTITPSYFWVTSVPDDSNKITVDIEVEE